MPKAPRHLAPRIRDHGRVRRNILIGIGATAVIAVLAGCALVARPGGTASADLSAIALPNPAQKSADQEAENAAAETANRMLRDLSYAASTAQDQQGIITAVTIAQQRGNYRAALLPSNIEQLGEAPYGAVVYSVEPLGEDGATILAYADGVATVKRSVVSATGKAYGCVEVTVHALNGGTDVKAAPCPAEASWQPVGRDGWSAVSFAVGGSASASPSPTATPSAG